MTDGTLLVSSSIAVAGLALTALYADRNTARVPLSLGVLALLVAGLSLAVEATSPEIFYADSFFRFSPMKLVTWGASLGGNLVGLATLALGMSGVIPLTTRGRLTAVWLLLGLPVLVEALVLGDVSLLLHLLPVSALLLVTLAAWRRPVAERI